MNQLSLRCRIRNKEVPHTPEEEVRQRILNYMIDRLGYPSGLIVVEKAVHFNSMTKRADIIVHDREAQPWMIVECKRPFENLTKRTMGQIAMYEHGLNAPYLMISNGNENHILYIDRVENSIKSLEAMPSYP